MKEIFKKYRWLKYAILIFILDVLIRGEIAYGGGAFVLTLALFAVYVSEHEAKEMAKDRRENRKY